MSWRRRSRSPHGHGDGNNSEWISRQIAQFGRYEAKRPSGLHVNKDGAISLKNLMAAWGKAAGISESDVRDALHQNANYNGGGARFTLEELRGDMNIIVNQKNRGAKWQKDSDNGRRRAWEGGQQWSSSSGRGTDRHWSSNDGATRSESSTNRGSFNVWGGKSTDGQNRGSWGGKTESRKDDRAWGRQDSSQEMRVHPSDKDKKPYTYNGFLDFCGGDKAKADRMWKESRPASNGSKPAESSGSHGRGWKASSTEWGRDSSMPVTEQVQRWLGKMLKTGYLNAGVQIKDEGWACLDVLADILREEKRQQQWKIFTGADLQEFIEKSDRDGRFEFNRNGEVKLVDRNSRVSRNTDSSNGRGSRKQHWSSHSTTSTSASGGVKEEQSDRAGDRTMNDESPRSPMSEDMAVKEEEENAPDGPPGEHWKKFEDDGEEWWYYEGPLGKWWKQKDRPVERYPGDGDEADE